MSGLNVEPMQFVPALLLARSTAMRLTLRYLMGYLAALLLALAAVKTSNTILTDQRAKSLLHTELMALTGGVPAPSIAAVQAAIVARLAANQAAGAAAAKQSGWLYLLVAPDASSIAGNMIGWPSEEEIAADGKVHTVEIEQEVLPDAWFDDDVFLPVLAIELAGGHRLLVSRKIKQARFLQAATEFLSEGLPLAVMLALALGLSLSFSILRRLRRINASAKAIMGGDLSHRVPISPRADEFDALAENLNAMFARNQQLLKGMREVTDNVAHDLRSPLTRLRSQLEICLLEPRSADEYRSAIALGIEETNNIIATFNSLLEIAQADAGILCDASQTIDLRLLAQDLLELYAPLAEDRQLHLELLAPTSSAVAHIKGNRDLLAQALGNLLENAVKFSPAGGLVQVRISVSAAAIEIHVSDTGPGIAPAERARVLERFVRLEPARHTAGNGLGLSLVNAVAKMHKAELQLSDTRTAAANKPAELPGLTVTLRFAQPR